MARAQAVLEMEQGEAQCSRGTPEQQVMHLCGPGRAEERPAEGSFLEESLRRTWLRRSVEELIHAQPLCSKAAGTHACLCAQPGTPGRGRAPGSLPQPVCARPD